MAVGKVTRPHGLKGEVRVTPFLTNREVLKEVKGFFLEKRGEERLKTEAVRDAPGGRDLLIKFEGVSSISEAEELRGRILYIDLEDLPPLEEDEFYYYQIEGFLVVDEAQKELGRVRGVMPVGPYELLEVERDGETFYIPLTEEVVKEMDFTNKIIRVSPTPNLIESQLNKS